MLEAQHSSDDRNKQAIQLDSVRRNAKTRGEDDSAEVSADMDWNELEEPESATITIEPIRKGSGSTSAHSAEVPPVIISAEGAAQKPKHIRPVGPDRVLAESIGGVKFRYDTTAKHSGKVATAQSGSEHSLDKE